MKTRLISRILAVVLILSLIFALAACSSKKDKLIGTWVNNDKTDEVTFRKDGYLTYKGLGERESESGSGTFDVNDDTLIIKRNNGTTGVYTIDFPNDRTLQIKDIESGRSGIYNKK